jgi:chemotaxis protein methyltransferase CheR
MGAEANHPGGGMYARLESEAYDSLRDVVLSAGGIDLGLYKDRCLLRRIAVRQRACGASDLRTYLRIVSRDPIERERLVKALTIHVSQFFRNPSTFQVIQREILPAVLDAKERTGGRALRLWSVGCACGEETYSLALLLLEAGRGVVERYSTVVYGSDIEPDCLRFAREGSYPAASLRSVPAQWKQPYFTATEAGYQVGPALRRLVSFKSHNVLEPMPFRRIDLVVFRNVLIYMTEALQERVLLALHETLTPGGFLVLGKVEGLAGAARAVFEAVNIPERIYRVRGPAGLPPGGGAGV